MDLVINACIQSPLFRNLSHVPADRLAFSHHITSNAPPLSKTKITVEPNVAQGSLDADYQFRIPQFGFLNKVVLRLEYDIYPITRFQVTPLLPLYHLIQEISLRTHHKPIQTIYGKEMLVKHAYFTEPTDKGAKFLGTLNTPPGPGLIDLGRMFPDPETNVPFDPIENVNDWTSRKRRVVMMVEVPLASTEAPHVNFDTRFVEHLDLYVKLTSTNGADRPIGMAAGLLEQDVSQEFNPVVDTSGIGGGNSIGNGEYMQFTAVAVPINEGSGDQADGYRWRWDVQCNHTLQLPDDFYAIGIVTDSENHFHRKGEIIMVDRMYSTLTATQETHQNCRIRKLDKSDDSIDSEGMNQIGEDFKANGATAAGVSPATGVPVSDADDNALESTAAEQANHRVGDILYNATDSKYVGVIRAITEDRYYLEQNTWNAVDNDEDLRVYRPPAIGSTIHFWGKLTTGTAVDTLPLVIDYITNQFPVETLSDPFTRQLQNASTTYNDYWKGGCLNWQMAQRKVAGNNGCIRFTDVNDETAVNSIGTPSCPLAPVNWLRVGCAYTEEANYKGWGETADAEVTNAYDSYNATTRSNSAFASATLHDNWLKNALLLYELPFTGTTTGFNRDAGTSTVGTMFKRAVLERYYSLYPHLAATSTAYDDSAKTTMWIGNNTTPTGAGTFSLDWPKLYGGNATNAASGTANNVSFSTPMNISLTLTCHFLNYHDKIREDIATENFKDNAPATILQYDTQQEVVNAVYGSSTSSYATTPNAEMVVHLKSNHLAYAISILAFKDKTSSQLNSATARNTFNRSVCKTAGLVNDFGCRNTGGVDVESVDNVQFPNYEVVENFKTIKPTYVALKGSGRPIYECGINATPGTSGLNSHFQNQDGIGRIPGAGNSLAEGSLDNLNFQYNKTEGYGSVQGPEAIATDFLSDVDRRIVGEFKDHASAHVISFGLNSTDQLANSGCLALQTINQPTLHLRFSEACRVYVYVHHYSMIQIDSNTGNITKSLDV